MSLLDFGLHFEEPSLDTLGDIVLCHDPDMECGSWKFWLIEDVIADDWPLFDSYMVHDISESLHICNGYSSWFEPDIDEGCILDEIN